MADEYWRIRHHGEEILNHLWRRLAWPRHLHQPDWLRSEEDQEDKGARPGRDRQEVGAERLLQVRH